MNNTLIKGLSLLEELSRSDRPLGITELSSRLNISKSNVHRMLQALVELRYVQQDGSAAYRASTRLWEIGSAVLERMDVRRIAGPFRDRLLEMTRETVHLSVLDGDEVVYIDKVDSPEPVRAYSQVGGRAPAYCVATGKAMLAWLTPSKLQVLAGQLRPHSPRTIIDETVFLQDMARVREAGYAVNRGEWHESVYGIAAPIRDVRQNVVAAIGISGPASRIRPAMFKTLALHVLEAAEGISLELTGASVSDAKGNLSNGVRRTRAM
jgi:DNA-binding IclR family transcriptional regulator